MAWHSQIEGRVQPKQIFSQVWSLSGNRHARKWPRLPLENLRRPLTELNAADWIDPITYGNDHVKIVVGNLSFNFAPTFVLNCCKKCNNWICIEFTGFKNILDMPGNRWLVLYCTNTHQIKGSVKLKYTKEALPRLCTLAWQSHFVKMGNRGAEKIWETSTDTRDYLYSLCT